MAGTWSAGRSGLVTAQKEPRALEMSTTTGLPELRSSGSAARVTRITPTTLVSNTSRRRGRSKAPKIDIVVWPGRALSSEPGYRASRLSGRARPRAAALAASSVGFSVSASLGPVNRRRSVSAGRVAGRFSRQRSRRDGRPGEQHCAMGGQAQRREPAHGSRGAALTQTCGSALPVTPFAAPAYLRRGHSAWSWLGPETLQRNRNRWHSSIRHLLEPALKPSSGAPAISLLI